MTLSCMPTTFWIHVLVVILPRHHTLVIHQLVLVETLAKMQVVRNVFASANVLRLSCQ